MRYCKTLLSAGRGGWYLRSGTGDGRPGPFPNNPYDDGSGWGGDSPTQTTQIIHDEAPAATAAGASSCFQNRAYAPGVGVDFTSPLALWPPPVLSMRRASRSRASRSRA